MDIKRKIIISIAIVGSIIGLIIYFIILPTIQDIKKISEAVYLERVDLERKYIRGQLLKKTLDDFEKVKPEKERLSSIFISQGKELEFITALEKIAVSRNLNQDIQLQTDSGKRSAKNLYPLLLEIEVNGDFIEILKYIKDLEKLNYYFNISSLKIGLNSRDSENTDVNTVLIGRIYTMPAEPIP